MHPITPGDRAECHSQQVKGARNSQHQDRILRLLTAPRSWTSPRARGPTLRGGSKSPKTRGPDKGSKGLRVPGGQGKRRAGRKAGHESAESQLREQSLANYQPQGCSLCPTGPPPPGRRPEIGPGMPLTQRRGSLQPQLSAQQRLPLPARAPGLGWGPARPTARPPWRRLGGGESKAHPRKGPEWFRRCPAPRRCRGSRRVQAARGLCEHTVQSRDTGPAGPSAAHWACWPPTPPHTPESCRTPWGARQRRTRGPPVTFPLAPPGSNNNK